MLAYLRTAEHITGDVRYAAAARELIEKHAYAANVMIPKTNAGPGSGNQSDDEMAFMNFYCLLRYEKDPGLREDAVAAGEITLTLTGEVYWCPIVGPGPNH